MLCFYIALAGCYFEALAAGEKLEVLTSTTSNLFLMKADQEKRQDEKNKKGKV
jgi:hypothetical protein